MKKYLKNLYRQHTKKVVGFTILLFLLFAFLTYRSFTNYRKTLDINIKASARKDGEYRRFLEAFIKELNSDSTKYNIRIEKIESPGASITTMQQLDSGYADIGLTQSNAKRICKNVAAVAYIYVEPYLLLTNHRDIDSISDIVNSSDTLTCARLGPNTQTSKDIKSLFGFYGIDSSKVVTIDAGYDSTATLLHDKRVDLGFFIIGLGNNAITNIMKDTSLNLVVLENREAYLLRKHKLIEFNLPKGIYGLNHPKADYKTFATKAMLIVRRDMNDNQVYEITKALFEKESDIAIDYPFFHLEKISDATENYIPVHAGALKYYNQNEPSFLDRNSNIVATLLSVFGLILSAIPLIIEFRNRKKKTDEET